MAIGAISHPIVDTWDHNASVINSMAQKHLVGCKRHANSLGMQGFEVRLFVTNQAIETILSISFWALSQDRLSFEPKPVKLVQQRAGGPRVPLSAYPDVTFDILRLDRRPTLHAFWADQGFIGIHYVISLF
ncbi:uncharacterized protein N7473_009263 [Penicillium subrubescens]|uniref:Uncharacterized protein n=1 Tax=Penicillium subrubescens TaxID=1316194 RepID=A0A1Q5TAK1_9EURO|nr:uncharacterized protein N7473_009263 [Penicillium subrubescens]KAJ5886589.1 hypothetical protein N7473_009263 [Penicillium subrubescens]OKO97255.1 hypothetical protein PENSUB_10049 [Penicillium subrubescens]